MSAKKQPKEEEDTSLTDLFETIVGSFAVITNLTLSKRKEVRQRTHIHVHTHAHTRTYTHTHNFN